MRDGDATYLQVRRLELLEKSPRTFLRKVSSKGSQWSSGDKSAHVDTNALIADLSNDSLEHTRYPTKK